MNIESKFEFEELENIEKEPEHNIVEVDLMRHGSTKYLEDYTSKEDKEKMKMDGKYPRDLTPKGEQEIFESAEKIIDKIDPEKEIVVLWSSPAWRAQGSEEIISELLAKKGVEAYKDSSIFSMRNFDQYDPKFVDYYWLELAPSLGKPAEGMYFSDPEFQEKNDKFESQPEVKKRAGRVFNWIRYLAEHAKLKGKKLHIIGVSHFEFFNPIISDIFNYEIEEGQGIKKGESLSMQFDFDKSSKELKISADFRGEHKSSIIFDKEKRTFLNKNDENETNL